MKRREGTSPEPGRGVLYVVATPIGNLGDITVRAIETLRSAHVIAAEDTRRTRLLLAHLGLDHKQVVRLDAAASSADLDRLCDRIDEGAIVALVTDAGTPVVSDPGTALVARARAREQLVSPMPGPSAVTAALSVSGFGGGGFRFLGFFPRSGRDRATALSELQRATEVVVFFEAPHRMAETLVDLAKALPARRALIAREITKLHEELIGGPLAEILARDGSREWLGEITVVVEPSSGATLVADPGDVDARAKTLLAEGRRAREVADLLSIETGLSRREAYDVVLRVKDA